MRQKSLGILVFLIFTFSVQNASATIIYDESASGDLGVGPSTFFTLGVGVSSIVGTAILLDTDDFGINAVAAGLEITGGVFTAMFGGTGNGNYNSSGIPVVGGGIFQGVINGDESVLIDAFPSGIFRVSNGGGSESIGWRFDFTVAAVPEPSTLGLLGAGLLGLFMRRKRVA